ncbi:sugar-transfer associated ATP-grasp domain-containing protein [Evansella sp. AB-P1]|uniref:sugar-transfer associated ATP-grasp domain-containing protein n=1 Tax=Evansella sp. AB-P1 TaxID=3037653 RepID=UPI00241D9938|nr:sugar-transfer associated ATP-grasp domain-containing protein [Evansella sp. AB-P1]MDG5786668.1 sugar-transfer associated ATP-grasp domain-containing protein [Evansella sp. AB-P1]
MDTEKTYIKTIEKSIKTIDLCLEYLKNEKYDDATNIYNLLLKTFEMIKDFNLNSDTSKFSMHLDKLELLHKKSIQQFESNKWDVLENHIVVKIKKQYLEIYEFLMQYFKYQKEYDININYSQYQEFKDANLINDLSNEDRDKLRAYWTKHFDVEKQHQVDRSVHYGFKTLTGVLEPRLISQTQLNLYILPEFYHSRIVRYYDDKNIYDILMHGLSQPKSILKRIKGSYFDGNTRSITRSKAFSIFFHTKEDVILKGSLGNDGKQVVKLSYKNNFFYLDNQKMNLDKIEEKFGSDFIIQEVIKQHPKLAKPHPYSVNTLRLMTLRWNGKIHYLGGYAKFGAEKSTMDNTLATGGFTVGINDDGVFDSEGMDGKMNRYESHPTTGFKFANLEPLDNYNIFKDFVKEAHDRIPHAQYVSWDIAVSTEEKPIFIEMNFRGPVYRYQIICKRPIFGDFTEEIFQYIKKRINEKNN